MQSLKSGSHSICLIMLNGKSIIYNSFRNAYMKNRVYLKSQKILYEMKSSIHPRNIKYIDFIIFGKYCFM